MRLVRLITYVSLVQNVVCSDVVTVDSVLTVTTVLSFPMSFGSLWLDDTRSMDLVS